MNPCCMSSDSSSVQPASAAAVTISAQTEIRLGGAGAGAIAKAGIVDLNFVAVIAKLNQALTMLSLPLMGSVTASGTSIAKAE